MVSVIIPVYNAEKFVHYCLDSVVNNTYRNIEVICVDDGSTDNTLQVLKRYAETDDRISVIQKSNGGVATAFNAGLEKANGEFCTFIGADDYIDHRFFEIMLEVMDEKNVDIVASNLQRFSSYEDMPLGAKYRESVEAVTISGAQAVTDRLAGYYNGGKLYKMSVIGKTLYDPKFRCGEDRMFNAELFSKGEIRIAVLKESLYFYFQRDDSLSHTITIDRPFVERYLELSKACKDLETSNRFCVAAFKGCLAIRYMRKDAEIDQWCNTIMSSLPILRGRNISLLEKISYYSFFRLPFTYNLFRYLNVNVKKSLLTRAH